MSNLIGGYPVNDSNTPGQVISPTLINSYSSLMLPPYWRAINFLADNLSSFPRSIYQGGVAVETHYLSRILRRKPNAYQNATQFWRTLFAHWANTGNGYARIIRKGFTNQVDSLHNMLPYDIWPFRLDQEDGRGLQQWYYHRPTKIIIAYNDCIHLAGLSYDGQCAYDPVWMHRDTLQRGISLDKFFTRYIMKGTVLRGAIEIPQGAQKEQVEELIATIRQFFTGADAERDVIVLSDGAKLNNATLSPQDSQLIEQASYTTKQIAQITGVPPQFLYEFSEQKYLPGAIESMGQDVVRYTFRPMIEQIEDELDTKLLTDAEQDAGLSVHLDPNALTRGDTTTETSVAVQKTNAGLASPNELRPALGLPPSTDPEADKLKRTGDTSKPGQTPTPPAQNSRVAGEEFAVKEHLNLSHFAELIADAADRVHKKTNKAVETAQKKYEGNTPAWTAWVNAFTPEQTNYAAVCVGPALKTYGNLSGKPIDGIADKSGKRYGRELGQHLMGHGDLPDLTAIVMEIGGANAS